MISVDPGEKNMLREFSAVWNYKELQSSEERDSGIVRS